MLELDMRGAHMKLIDVINNIDTSDENSDYVSIYGFCESVWGSYDIFSDESSKIFESQMKSYWINSWYCTDTYVGYKVYIWNGTPCAVSSQSARKERETIEFLSGDLYRNIKNWINSLVDSDEENHLIDPRDLEQEIDDTYRVSYGSQTLEKQGFVDGVSVTVVKIYDSYNNISQWKLIDCKFPDGSVKTIETKDFRIPIHVKALS